MLRIKYNPGEQRYTVMKFVKDHSHELASRRTVQFLRSHRNVNNPEIDLARTMRMAGIHTCEIMRFFVMQAGGYE